MNLSEIFITHNIMYIKMDLHYVYDIKFILITFFCLNATQICFCRPVLLKLIQIKIQKVVIYVHTRKML